MSVCACFLGQPHNRNRFGLSGAYSLGLRPWAGGFCGLFIYFVICGQCPGGSSCPAPRSPRSTAVPLHGSSHARPPRPGPRSCVCLCHTALLTAAPTWESRALSEASRGVCRQKAALCGRGALLERLPGQPRRKKRRLGPLGRPELHRPLMQLPASRWREPPQPRRQTQRQGAECQVLQSSPDPTSGSSRGLGQAIVQQIAASASSTCQSHPRDPRPPRPPRRGPFQPPPAKTVSCQLPVVCAPVCDDRYLMCSL